MVQNQDRFMMLYLYFCKSFFYQFLVSYYNEIISVDYKALKEASQV